MRQRQREQKKNGFVCCFFLSFEIKTSYFSNRMEPASAEKLLEAFRLLDTDGKGTLSKDNIGKLMTEEGEPFTQVNKQLQNNNKNIEYYFIIDL